MSNFEEYFDKAKDIADDAREGAMDVADEVMSKVRELTDDGRKVLALLPCDESVTADTLMDRSSLPIPRILSALTLLIQAGYAEETTRGSFKRSAALRNGEDAVVSSLKTADEGFS